MQQGFHQFSVCFILIYSHICKNILFDLIDQRKHRVKGNDRQRLDLRQSLRTDRTGQRFRQQLQLFLSITPVI